MATNVDRSLTDLESLQAQALVQGDIAVLTAVNQNTELLQQLFERLKQASGTLEPEDAFAEFDSLGLGNADDSAIEAVDENIRLRAENTRLNNRINSLEKEIESVSENHYDLANRVVYGPDYSNSQPDEPVEQPVSLAPLESLSWEERKRQIIEQMENDEFDAESFLTTLNVESESDSGKSDTQQAIDYVNELADEIDRLRQGQGHQPSEQQHELQQQIEQYIDEVSELKESLRELQEASLTNQSESDDGSTDSETLSESPAPVDPIADILDSDQIIQEERERLHQMQVECEQKLRDIEIRSSLERAKLSRELSLQVQKNQELETQVVALQRQVGMKEDPGVGTRWMAKLGLTSDRGD